jgi:hypothetical protein
LGGNKFTQKKAIIENEPTHASGKTHTHTKQSQKRREEKRRERSSIHY